MPLATSLSEFARSAYWDAPETMAEHDTGLTSLQDLLGRVTRQRNMLEEKRKSHKPELATPGLARQQQGHNAPQVSLPPGTLRSFVGDIWQSHCPVQHVMAVCSVAEVTKPEPAASA